MIWNILEWRLVSVYLRLVMVLYLIKSNIGTLSLKILLLLSQLYILINDINSRINIILIWLLLLNLCNRHVLDWIMNFLGDLFLINKILLGRLLIYWLNNLILWYHIMLSSHILVVDILSLVHILILIYRLLIRCPLIILW